MDDDGAPCHAARDGMGMSLTGPFTLRRGLDAGLSERVMRGPGYRRLFHGVYAPVEPSPR